MSLAIYHVERHRNLPKIFIPRLDGPPRKPWWKRLSRRLFGDPVRIATKVRYQDSVTPSDLNVETDIINLANQDDDYIVEGYVSLQNMADGDSVEIKVYIAVDGSNQVLSDKMRFTDKQEIPVVRVLTHVLPYNAKFRVTVTQTAGTLRSFPYAFIVQVMEVV